MKLYRVVINHNAGHLVIRKVEAANKLAAEQLVRESFGVAGPIVLGRTSSVTAVNE